MPVLSGGLIVSPAEIITEEFYIQQQSSAAGGVYTASVTVPANSWIWDIRIYCVSVWDSVTSAVLKVGDVSVTDGFYTGIDCLVTDFLAGEVLSFDSAGGKPGAYIVAATGLRNTMWSATARVISAVVTEVTTTGHTAGLMRGIVAYTTTSTAGAATFA